MNVTTRGRLRAGSKRVLIGVAVGSLAITGVVLAGGAANAVHDEAFELDGNVDDANPVGGPEVDWDNDIVGVGANGFSAPQTSLPAGFSAATAGPDFTTEIRRGVEVAVTADNTTFTTNSKDILDISAEWRCVRANNVTDKGDLVNTYAVAYTNAAGELILYFGAEKNDASGINNIGVWFLQDATVNCMDTQGQAKAHPFTGNHVDRRHPPRLRVHRRREHGHHHGLRMGSHRPCRGEQPRPARDERDLWRARHRMTGCAPSPTSATR